AVWQAIGLIEDATKPETKISPKALWDATSGLVGLFVENPFLAEAAKLEEEVKQMQDEDLRINYALAQDKLKAAKKRIQDVQELVKDSKETYEIEQGNVENEFDDNTKGAFQFKKLRPAIELAQRIKDLAVKAARASGGAKIAVEALDRADVPPSQWVPPTRSKEDWAVISALHDTARNMFRTADGRFNEARQIGESLRATYAQAQEDLFKAPGV